MEETKVLNDNNQGKTEKKDNSKWGVGVGSYVAGAVSASAVNAVAGDRPAAEPEVEETPAPADTVASSNNQEPAPIDPAQSPAAAEVILATDEGVRVAQVDDSASFAQAFADARAQVGPGGVFEWRGKVYGTYYKEEWDNMSSTERAEYQSRIDYDDVRQHDNHTQASMHHTSQPVVTNDDEIRVLGVETVQGPNGQPMTVAGLESDNDQALLVDIDNDGQFDVLLHDDNGDGQLQENEVYDISAAHVEVADLEQATANQNGMQYASNDGMPDYMNDADISSMA